MEITEDLIKKQARLLQKFLNGEENKISYCSCLHAMAAIHDFENWNTMLAHLKKENCYE